MATYCCLCGAPVNHFHYEVAPDDDAEWVSDEDICYLLEVDEEELQRFAKPAFDARHEWLKKAIAFKDGTVVSGRVYDNCLISEGESERLFVCNGLGDGNHLTIHEACWVLAGRPTSDEGFPKGSVFSGSSDPDSNGEFWSVPWGPIEPYMQGQLFDFRDLMDDEDKAWLIEEPSDATPGGARNKARIQSIISFESKVVSDADLTQEQRLSLLLKLGAWTTVSSASLEARFRTDVSAVDKANYARLAQIKKPYPALDSGLPQPQYRASLYEYAKKLQEAVAFQFAGVMVAVSTEAGHQTHWMYLAKGAEFGWPMSAIERVEATSSTLEENGELQQLSAAAEITLSDDPAWEAASQAIASFKART